MKKRKKTPQNKSDAVALELRRLGVTLDDVKHQGSLTAEMVGHLSKNMEIVKEDISGLKEDVSGLKEDVSGLKKTQGVHTEMIGSLATNLEIVKEDIEFIKNGFKRKVDVEEFTALTRRVSLLERRR